MNTFIRIIFLTLTLLLVFGCSRNDPSIDHHPKEQLDYSQLNVKPELEKDDSGVKSTGLVNDKTVKELANELSFHKLNIQVTYGAGEYYDLQFENPSNHNEVYALIKENISGSYVKGMDAFMGIYTLFQNIHFENMHSNEIIISKMLNTLKLNEDFNTISLEMKFHNGEKIQINQ